MASIDSRILFNNYNAVEAGRVMIEAAYDPVGGCKGGLRYMRIAPTNISGGGTATGTYYVNLKNINAVKYNVTDLNDGDFSFDMSRVSYICAEVVSTNPSSAPTLGISTAVQYDSANNQYIVYIYNQTGLIALPAGNRIVVTATYNSFNKVGI